MKLFKEIIIILFSLTFGFGVWYLVFWFISLQFNPFKWGLGAKFLYLFLTYLSTESMLDRLRKQN
jgi:hypothetical protein